MDRHDHVLAAYTVFATHILCVHSVVPSVPSVVLRVVHTPPEQVYGNKLPGQSCQFVLHVDRPERVQHTKLEISGKNIR